MDPYATAELSSQAFALLALWLTLLAGVLQYFFTAQW